MKKFYLVTGYKKSGRLTEKSLSGLSSAMLRLYALQNTKPTQISFLFDEDGVIHWIFEGRKDNMPKITDYTKNDTPEFIEDWIPGIMLSMAEVHAK